MIIMGFDLILGILVVILAIRGWLKGFVLQAIRLAGLVACVYLADPVRDLAKPHVVGYLPTIRPDLVDRLLWWSASIVSFITLVGVATLAVNLYRRQPIGLAEPDRTDQFAGFLLGTAKGLVVAAFIAAGVQKYAMDSIKSVPFAEKQTRDSMVLRWSERYRPVARIWSLPPVRSYVSHIQRMGLNSPQSNAETNSPALPSVRTAVRTPKLELPVPGLTERDARSVDPEVARAVEEALRQVGRPN
ncbi:MAG: CvpA family protein [Planctomycetaceae bacterium]|nr:CvpA family protein [Planctomycetaceae bacterium]